MDRNELTNEPEIAFRIAFSGQQSSIWTALPGIVQDVDLVNMVVSVQPTIQGRIQNPDGTVQWVNLPVLIHVPIVFPSAGGFTITFPIAVNDEVLVVFSSRCIDSWWQSSGVQKPAEMRMHDLSDGFAIPGPRSVPRAVPGISSTALQIRNDAGTSYLEITPSGKINIVAPTGLEVTGNMVVSGSVTAGSVVGGGKNLATHVHSGVTTGGGTSGPPV